MADSYLKLIYTLELSDREMRLVCLGLSNNLTHSEDRKAARELNLKLLKAQSIRIGEQQTKIDGALKKATEELDEN